MRKTSAERQAANKRAAQTKKAHYGPDFFARIGKLGNKKAGERARELSRASIKERLWAKVQVGDAAACWPWLAYMDARGCGVISFLGRDRKAHHVLWEIIHGPLEDGTRVYHRCGNHACCNPDHLFIENAESRFWSKVAVRSAEDCWDWLASTGVGGYGQFHPGRRLNPIKAHRYAYELAHGPIPDKKRVLHRCDRPSCCNPAHLFLGTIAENNRDRHAKGRDARGSRVGNAKLTDAQVVEMRCRYQDGGITQRQLANDYALGRGTVSAILGRRTWKHL